MFDFDISNFELCLRYATQTWEKGSSMRSPFFMKTVNHGFRVARQRQRQR